MLQKDLIELKTSEKLLEQRLEHSKILLKMAEIKLC